MLDRSGHTLVCSQSMLAAEEFAMFDFKPRPALPDAMRRGNGIGVRVRRIVPLVRLAVRTVGEAIVGTPRRQLTGAQEIEFQLRTAERYAELLGHSKGVLMKAG